jgi:hypothetical protein
MQIRMTSGVWYDADDPAPMHSRTPTEVANNEWLVFDNGMHRYMRPDYPVGVGTYFNAVCNNGPYEGDGWHGFHFNQRTGTSWSGCGGKPTILYPLNNGTDFITCNGRTFGAWSYEVFGIDGTGGPGVSCDANFQYAYEWLFNYTGGYYPNYIVLAQRELDF